ncbi:MAG: hypothetical protein IT374_03400 [Polyangiaceae bacterium]|nr:hypothetical protein [Polyangiaceae bacterium]
MKLKGLQPDFWPDLDEVAGNGVGAVAMNLVWAVWESTKKSAPCGAKEQEYDGRCFVVDAGVDQAIKAYSDRGVAVTAIVYGVPGWARAGHPCSPVAAGFEIFCSPDDAADYGRFAGMLARRYDGKSGHGRVADFVIHNEVNANDWFDIGCGQGKACDVDAWLDAYAASFSAAYDRVIDEQATAKVLVSLDHHFGKQFDTPAAAHPLLGGQTVLEGLAARVGARKWRVAMHPYPPDLLKPAFSPDDDPKVTYGSLGVLAGWLRRTFPTAPWTWEIQLTESGVNSLGPGSSEAAQADGVCKSLRNALGTPGVESYIYHRMKDHPVETASGLGVGLRDTNGKAKAAWAVWALANRPDVGKVSCGFEDLPYVRLTRSYSAARGHWASTREPPTGFTKEQSWRLSRDPQPGTHLLFECRAGAHSLVSPSASCEGLPPLGPLGYAWDAAGGGRVALHRCYVPGSGDHFVSPDAGCEGQTVEQTLGWVLP